MVRQLQARLVSVEKRVIPGDAHRQHGCLVEEIGVPVVSAERCLGSVKGRIEKVDPNLERGQRLPLRSAGRHL